MGTRAAFWVGNPTDLKNREWLGCIAYDGYPDGQPAVFMDVHNEDSFRAAVESMAESLDDYTPPGNGSAWPFPWDDDIFLTDYNYAWFDGKINIASFHSGWVSWDDYSKWRSEDHGDGDYLFEEDTFPEDTYPAPGKYDRSLPDSIMVIGVANDGGLKVCSTA